MRRLFRSALALFGAGLALIGYNRPDSTGTSGNPAPNEGPIDAPHQAVFRVPGMS